MQILEVEESLIAKKDVPCWFRAVFDMEYVMVHLAMESSSEPNLKFQFNLIPEMFFFCWIFVGILCGLHESQLLATHITFLK